MDDCCRAIVLVCIVRTMAFDANVVFWSLLVLHSAIFCAFGVDRMLGCDRQWNLCFSIRFSLFISKSKLCLGLCSSVLHSSNADDVEFSLFFSSLIPIAFLCTTIVYRIIRRQCRWEKNLRKYNTKCANIKIQLFRSFSSQPIWKMTYPYPCAVNKRIGERNREREAGKREAQHKI